MKNIKTEWIKQSKIIIIICILCPIILNAFLYIDLTFRYEGYLLKHQVEYGLTNWQLIFKEQSVFYMAEIVHILVAAIVYELYAQEIKGNAWNIVASTQYIRKVNIGKFMVAAIDMFLYFVVNYSATVCVGKQIGVEGNIEWMLVFRSFFIQYIATIMMIGFYIMIISMLKKVFSVIPIAIVLFFANLTFYYVDNISLLIHLPFTYSSYAFRASDTEGINMFVISVVLTIICMSAARICLVRKREII